MSPPERWSLVVSCEHASRRWPSELSRAGLDDAVLETHAAWDPGAQEVAQAVAGALGAPLFLGRYTRLFVDLNRSPGSEESVPVRAFGVEVVPNQGLTADARARRISAHHTPYWSAVKKAVQAGLQRGDRVLHLSVHSFVEEYAGQKRELDLGLLYDPASALEHEAAALLAPVLSRAGYVVRDNEPYDGRADALTTALRGELLPGAYAGVELEISQRLLGSIETVGATVAAAVRGLVG